MLKAELSPEGLGGTRFGYSALAEVVGSVRVLQSPNPPWVMRRWRARTLARLTRGDLELLASVVPAPPHHYAPDFFFAHSMTTPSAALEAQLAELRATPSTELVEDLRHAWAPREPARMWLRSGDVGERLADLIGRYWQSAIAPYWERMGAVIDADVERRCSRMAREGLARVINDLHETLSISDGEIRVLKPYLDKCLADARPVLIPTVFTWPRLAVIHDQHGRFDLFYGVEGVGRVWDRPVSGGVSTPLAELIGRGRADILLRLGRPKTTTELAAEAAVSPSTVSQHLSILRNARMVRADRQGRAVLYRRTALADTVVTQVGAPRR